MVGPLGPADLIKFHSSVKISDFKDWAPVPASAVVQQTAQMKAELAASEDLERRQKADFDAETKAKPDFYSPKSETNAMFLTNVATLSESELQPRIDYVTRLIQSGESEKYSFQSGNGEQTTTSIHQYLYWLQQRSQSLNGDGTYSPAMFK